MGSAETAKLSETDYEPYFRTSQTREVRARRESSFLEPLYLHEDDPGCGLWYSNELCTGAPRS